VVVPDLGFRIAAIREAFEESGQLLARSADGGPCSLEALRQVRVHRAAIAAETGSFLEAMRAAGLVPDVGALQLYAHWITPEGMPKRFDTLFYLAEAPADQLASEDGREAVEACWVAPATALADAVAGRRTIIFPTRLNLERLSDATSIAEAKAQTAARAIVPVLPAVVMRGSEPWLTIPAEAGYRTTEEPLEGNRP
jgi:8-oxo-dGTP pyrophosphatase MutT (NUDIX family)